MSLRQDVKDVKDVKDVNMPPVTGHSCRGESLRALSQSSAHPPPRQWALERLFSAAGAHSSPMARY